MDARQLHLLLRLLVLSFLILLVLNAGGECETHGELWVWVSSLRSLFDKFCAFLFYHISLVANAGFIVLLLYLSWTSHLEVSLICEISSHELTSLLQACENLICKHFACSHKHWIIVTTFLNIESLVVASTFSHASFSSQNILGHYPPIGP